MNLEDDLTFAKITLPQNFAPLHNRQSLYTVLYRSLKARKKKKYNTQTLFKVLLFLDVLNAVLALISIAVGILESEMTFFDHSSYILLPDNHYFLLYSDSEENNTPYTLRLIGLLITSCLLIAVLNRWKINLDYLKSRGILTNDFKLWRSWMFLEFLIEISFIGITPIPRLNFVYEMIQLNEIKSYYSFDTFAMLFVISRCYLFIRVLFTLKGYKAPRLDLYYSMRSETQYISKPWNSIWSFKVSLKLYPVSFVIMIFGLILLWGSLVTRINEKASTIYGNLDWDSFENSLWYITIIITSVGFGDIYPQTHLGRVTSMIVMLIGNFLLSILIVKLKGFTAMNEKQFSAYKQIKVRQYMKQVRLMKIIIIQRFFKAFIYQNNKRLFDFVSAIDEIRKSRIKASNLNEIGINRYNLIKMNYLLGDYLREIVGDVPKTWKTIENKFSNINEKQKNVNDIMRNIHLKLEEMKEKLIKNKEKNLNFRPLFEKNSLEKNLNTILQKNIKGKKISFPDSEKFGIIKTNSSCLKIENDCESVFRKSAARIENDLGPQNVLQEIINKKITSFKNRKKTTSILLKKYKRITKSREMIEIECTLFRKKIGN